MKKHNNNLERGKQKMKNLKDLRLTFNEKGGMKMEKLQLFESKSGRTSLVFDLDSRVFEIHYWKYQTWEEEKTDRSEEFEGLISGIIDREIKQAEKHWLNYCQLDNDYPVFYYENTDKIG